MKRLFFIIFWCIISSALFEDVLANSFVQQKEIILIRLYNSYKITSINFFQLSGGYKIYGDSVELVDSRIDNISFVSVSLVGDSLLLKLPNVEKKLASVRFVPKNATSSFKLKSVKPNYKVRTYDDELSISAQKKTLRIINKVHIEKYVAGVVQWEVGTRNSKEFNKVKTIVCRTYALGNWRRHEGEGFQLCDEVHCQVFKGKTYSKNIREAASETAEYILVDDSARIITSAFHSNCGGQTMNSEDVWSKSVSSLRSVRDTFCIHKTNANWEKRIPKDLWLDYVGTKYGCPVDDPSFCRKILNFDQPNRQVNLLNDEYYIPLKFVRADMKLKSTFFTIKEKGENVVFTGKGFGHGVGLCQEGAMRMGEKGYSYTKIINHYYANIHLIRFSQLDFFRIE